MPDEKCGRRLRSLLCFCDVFPALINSVVSWFVTNLRSSLNVGLRTENVFAFQSAKLGASAAATKRRRVLQNEQTRYSTHTHTHTKKTRKETIYSKKQNKHKTKQSTKNVRKQTNNLKKKKKKDRKKTDVRFGCHKPILGSCNFPTRFAALMHARTHQHTPKSRTKMQFCCCINAPSFLSKGL